MNHITGFSPTEIISLQQGQPVTTSLKVAELFGKRHDDVLKKIRNLECSAEFNLRNFAEVSYEVVQPNGGKANYKAYEMTKDGFIFVVMGFTGVKAAATKEAYINAFNWMAEQLATQRPQPAISLTDDELCTLTWCWRAADRMMEAARSIYPLLEVAEHRDAGRYYSIIHEYPYTLNQARKILADRTRHIQPNTHGDTDWPKLIPHLRRDQLTIGWCR
ncbi:Rha family transcriptional regulator [Aeromonas caviae]|uniref:Rha family transcriptional regulator n=1 Tax=Aeromonas caviae TaxID=648 RepID=UPI0029DE196A|nr:Rha family transcriptional regulator [Aeromonas caviae]MDX7735370.1 Rha family transcriptional regulator [Aeromonas caviae]